ncbi:hypothetical protein GCM10010433_44010 [Streptomyces pulveraceus]
MRPGGNGALPGQGAGPARDQEYQVTFRAGRRTRAPCRAALVAMLNAHRETQERERKAAGDLWAESDYVFTMPRGGLLSPNTDYHD